MKLKRSLMLFTVALALTALSCASTQTGDVGAIEEIPVVEQSSYYYPTDSLDDLAERGAILAIAEIGPETKSEVWAESPDPEDPDGVTLSYDAREFTLVETVFGEVEDSFGVLLPSSQIDASGRTVATIRDGRSDVEGLRDATSGTRVAILLWRASDGLYFAYGNLAVTEVAEDGSIGPDLLKEEPSSITELQEVAASLESRDR